MGRRQERIRKIVRADLSCSDSASSRSYGSRCQRQHGIGRGAQSLRGDSRSGIRDGRRYCHWTETPNLTALVPIQVDLQSPEANSEEIAETFPRIIILESQLRKASGRERDAWDGDIIYWDLESDVSLGLTACQYRLT